MKYLVLGSAGQIGSALVPYLERRGHRVWGLDIENAPAQDLRRVDNEILIDRVRRADFVVFLAFDVGGSRYLRTCQHSSTFLSNNVKIMDNTFSVLQRFPTPFLFSSSQMANMTYSPYGALKAVGDCYTRALHGRIARFWNVYGLERDLRKAHVITDFLLQARDRGVIEMLTDGREQRQFLHVDDCCECLAFLSERHDMLPCDRELHITTFQWHTIRDVAQCVVHLYPGTQIVPGRSGDDVQRDKRNEPDPFILQYWQPKTSLEAGIRRVRDQMEQT
jgi:nucleoside-diphosphate-sugar epimerase